MADEYGDDFEVDTSQSETNKPSGGLSLLRSAAAAVDKEERAATAAALESGAAEMKGVAKLLGEADKKLDETLDEGNEEEEDEEIELDGDEDLDFELNSSSAKHAIKVT